MAIAYVAQKTKVNGTSVTKPVGTSTGNLLLCVQGIADTTSTGVGASGFTEVTAAHVTDGPASSQFRLWWKVAGGSEPASYTFTNSSSVYQSLVMLLFSGNATTSPSDGAATGNFSSGATGITYPSLTTTANGDLLLGVSAGNPINTPVGMTTRVSGDWDGNDVATAVQTTAGATGTSYGETFSGATSWTGPYFIAAFLAAGGATSATANAGLATAALVAYAAGGSGGSLAGTVLPGDIFSAYPAVASVSGDASVTPALAIASVVAYSGSANGDGVRTVGKATATLTAFSATAMGGSPATAAVVTATIATVAYDATAFGEADATAAAGVATMGFTAYPFRYENPAGAHRSRCPFCRGSRLCFVCGGTGWVNLP